MLPAKERARYEHMAELAKQEHKRRYPDYRFQPKHDPEKKKKRQAAKAEKERREKEEAMRLGMGVGMGIASGSAMGGMETPMDGGSGAATPLELLAQQQQLQMGLQNHTNAQIQMSMGRNHLQHQQQQLFTQHGQQQLPPHQMRAPTNFHLGHRRSSSVPLASDLYPGYPFSLTQQQQIGQYGFPHLRNQIPPQADPFNFANPAIANASLHHSQNQGDGQDQAGIALPSLPNGYNGFRPSWFGVNSNATAPSQALTLSRAGSPELSFSSFSNSAGAAANNLQCQDGQGNGGNDIFATGFPRLSSMGLNGLQLPGMGARASHTFQLGQVGRRASSTRPSLLHQLNSGLFDTTFDQNGYGGAQQFDPRAQFSSFTFGSQQAQQGFDGFVGAVAEGFTDPFAPASQTSENGQGGSQSNPGSANGGWYDREPVDPMTPVYPMSAPSQSQSQVQNQSTIIDPNFSFGSATISNTADNSNVTQSPKSTQMTTMQNGTPGNDFALVQPVPVRKTAASDFTADQTQTQQLQHGFVDSQYGAADSFSDTGVNASAIYSQGAPQVAPHPFYNPFKPQYSQGMQSECSTQTSEGTASSASLEASPDVVASLELLDGAVSISQNANSQSQSQGQGQLNGQGQKQFGQQASYQYATPSQQQQFHVQNSYVPYQDYAAQHVDVQNQVSQQQESNQHPRFSMSEFINSPFVAASAVAN